MARWRPGPWKPEHSLPADGDEAALAADHRGAHPPANDQTPAGGPAVGRAEAQLGHTEVGDPSELLNMSDGQPPSVWGHGWLGAPPALPFPGLEG